MGVASQKVKGRRGPGGGGERQPRVGWAWAGLSGLPLTQSLGEMQQLQKTLTSPAEAAGFLQGSRDSGGSSKDSSCDTDDFVMVPAQFPGQGPRCVWAGVPVGPDPSLPCPRSPACSPLSGIEGRLSGRPRGEVAWEGGDTPDWAQPCLSPVRR